jgi:hypothetical protein
MGCENEWVPKGNEVRGLRNGGREREKRRNEEEKRIDCTRRMYQGVEGDLRARIGWIRENNLRKKAR